MTSKKKRSRRGNIVHNATERFKENLVIQGVPNNFVFDTKNSCGAAPSPPQPSVSSDQCKAIEAFGGDNYKTCGTTACSTINRTNPIYGTSKSNIAKASSGFYGCKANVEKCGGYAQEAIKPNASAAVKAQATSGACSCFIVGAVANAKYTDAWNKYYYTMAWWTKLRLMAEQDKAASQHTFTSAVANYQRFWDTMSTHGWQMSPTASNKLAQAGCPYTSKSSTTNPNNNAWGEKASGSVCDGSVLGSCGCYGIKSNALDARSLGPISCDGGPNNGDGTKTGYCGGNWLVCPQGFTPRTDGGSSPTLYQFNTTRASNTYNRGQFFYCSPTRDTIDKMMELYKCGKCDKTPGSWWSSACDKTSMNLWYTNNGNSDKRGDLEWPETIHLSNAPTSSKQLSANYKDTKYQATVSWPDVATGKTVTWLQGATTEINGTAMGMPSPPTLPIPTTNCTYCVTIGRDGDNDTSCYTQQKNPATANTSTTTKERLTKQRNDIMATRKKEARSKLTIYFVITGVVGLFGIMICIKGLISHIKLRVLPPKSVMPYGQRNQRDRNI